jgi:hypothetical protein
LCFPQKINLSVIIFSFESTIFQTSSPSGDTSAHLRRLCHVTLC